MILPMLKKMCTKQTDIGSSFLEPENMLPLLEEQLSNYGIAFIRNINSLEQYINFIHSIGTIIPHRDSNETGLTKIHNTEAQVAGYKGFTNTPLRLHTDRSCTPSPPVVMSCWIGRQAETGGESVFLDGAFFFHELKNKFPALFELITTEPAGFINQENILQSPVLYQNETGRFLIRFRDDELIRFGEQTKKIKDTLNQLMEEQATVYRLNNNECYILNNTRVLHGRTHFSGYREIYRAFINPLHIKVEPGFTL